MTTPRYQITASDANGVVEWCSAEGMRMAHRIARRLAKTYPGASIAISPL